MAKTRTKKSSRPFRRYTKKYRSSTMGKVFPPLDVRSSSDLKQFEKRLKKGPLTIVLVYADWCGHCHTMMPHFDAASKSPNRSIQSVKVNEQMLNSVNNYINKNVNRSSKPLSVEGYPSIILVDKKGNKVTDIEPVRNTSVMTKVMNESAKVASNSINNSKNTGVSNANVGIENTGMVGKLGSNSLSPINTDVGENELKGSPQPVNSLKLNNKPRMKPDDMLIKNEDMTPNNKLNNKKNSNFDLEDSIAPSPLNTFTVPKNTNKEPNFNVPKNIEKTTDQLVNLQGPIEPPSSESDLVSDNLTPAEKMEGGGCGCAYGRRGGSLMSSISQAAYTLATPAALLATASYVMKKPSRKSGKKQIKRKTYKRRR